MAFDPKVEAEKRDRILAGDFMEWHKLEEHILLKTSSWIATWYVDRETVINSAIYEAAKRWKPKSNFYTFATTKAIGRLCDSAKRNKRHIHEGLEFAAHKSISEHKDSICYGLTHHIVENSVKEYTGEE